MNKCNVKRVWLYCRSATNDVNALESQKNRLVSFANSNGYVIVGLSHESGSGLNFDREELNRVLTLAGKEYDVLLVQDISRIGRDYLKTLDFVNQLESKGVQVIDVITGGLAFTHTDPALLQLMKKL